MLFRSIEEVKLNSLINDCLNIEKDIKMIDNIKENINKYNEANILEVGFATDKKDEVNDLIDMIKNPILIKNSLDYTNIIKGIPKNVIVCIDKTKAS